MIRTDMQWIAFYSIQITRMISLLSIFYFSFPLFFRWLHILSLFLFFGITMFCLFSAVNLEMWQNFHANSTCIEITVIKTVSQVLTPKKKKTISFDSFIFNYFFLLSIVFWLHIFHIILSTDLPYGRARCGSYIELG